MPRNYLTLGKLDKLVLLIVTIGSDFIGPSSLGLADRLVEREAQMIVIIEVADLTGKSTLATALAARCSWPIAKIRWELLGDLEVETRTMANSTSEILRAIKLDVILDRIYFLWWVYGPALCYDVTYMPELVTAFAAIQDTRLVLLTAGPDDLADRFARQPDLDFSLEVIQAANARFPSLLSLLPLSLPRLHIDTTIICPEQMAA